MNDLYLLPDDLRVGAILPQCLDDAYVPPDVFDLLMRTGVTYADERVRKARHEAANTEFLRSLLYGSQVVINRAFFVNNPFLYEFYENPKKGDVSRRAFATLMRGRAIVPFLSRERSLGEDLPFKTSERGRKALERLLDELGSDYLPLRLGDASDEAANLHAAAMGTAFTTYFTNNYAMSIENNDIRYVFTAMLRELTETADVSEADVRAFKDDFDRVGDFIAQSPTSVGRHELYAHFFADGSDAVVAGDFRQPSDLRFVREIKKLIDLRYNTVLPDALGRYCLTPANLPSRSALQDYAMTSGTRLLDDAAQIETLRREFMALGHHILRFPRITDFTLTDVVEVQKLDAFRAFTAAQSDVLSQKNPLRAAMFLDHYSRALYAYQDALHAYHSKHVVRDPIQRRCSMAVRLVVRVAGIMLDLMPVPDYQKILYSVTSEFGWDLLPSSLRGLTVELVVNVFDHTNGARLEEHSRQLQLMRDDAEYTKAELREFVEHLQGSSTTFATIHDNASQSKR